MIVDVHAHYHPRPYNQALERAGVVRAGGGSMAGHPDTDDEEHIQKRLEMMEEAGVGLQVLSPAAGRAPYGKDEPRRSKRPTRQRHLRRARGAVSGQVQGVRLAAVAAHRRVAARAAARAWTSWA